LFYAVFAEGTLVHISVGMGVTGIIRTRGDASAASDAFMVGYQYDPSFRIMTGTCGATANTGRVVAVVAAF
jgi:hypothetical protein